MDGATNRLKFAEHGETDEEDDIRMGSPDAQDYFSKIGDMSVKRPLKVELENADSEEVEEIRRMFDLFDKDGNGQITANELRHVIRSLPQSTTEAEIMDIMQSIDAGGNGVIEFPEFFSIISDKLQKVKENEELEKAFKVFDMDGTGEITAKNLQRLFTIFGQDFSEAYINDMLTEADFDHDKKMKFKDFVKMMEG